MKKEYKWKEILASLFFFFLSEADPTHFQITIIEVWENILNFRLHLLSSPTLQIRSEKEF